MDCQVQIARTLLAKTVVNFFIKIIRLGVVEYSKALGLQQYSIGRSSDCDIQLRGQVISRRHCTLILTLPDSEKSDYGYMIWDGVPMLSRSAGGTFVNGSKIHFCNLASGDVITFSNCEYPQIIFVIEHESSVGKTLEHEYKKYV